MLLLRTDCAAGMMMNGTATLDSSWCVPCTPGEKMQQMGGHTAVNHESLQPDAAWALPAVA